MGLTGRFWQVGYRRGLAIAGFALLLGGVAEAAEPFCVSVTGLLDQCVYVDGRLCQQRANQLGGTCTLNRAAGNSPPGFGQFCLAVDGQAVQCIYSDRNTCLAAAARQKTACVQALPPSTGAVDPFAIRRPY